RRSRGSTGRPIFGTARGRCSPTSAGWRRATRACSRASPPTTPRTAARRWRSGTGWAPTARRAPGGSRVGGAGRAPAPAPAEDADAGERDKLRTALIEGSLPASARWLAGELLEYHRREARPGWWWFFERRDHMTEEELLDDPEAVAGLAPLGKPVADKNSFV